MKPNPDRFQTALLVDGKLFTRPRPARHHDLIMAWIESTHGKRFHDDGRIISIPSHEQGFVDPVIGVFIDREEAAFLFRRDGGRLSHPPELFSEDLW